MATDPRVADLVRSGQIRIALFLPQYTRDSATAKLRGLGIGYLGIELAHALAARLGIAARLTELATPPQALDAIRTGGCDIGFLGIEPSRVAQVDFTPPFVQFDYTYLVPKGSPILAAVGADRPGIRIAVVRNHASTLALGRMIKHAELVGRDLPDAAFEAEAFAAPREQLLDYAARLPGSRVLADHYGINNVGIAITKGRPERLAFISEFVEDAKASGLLADLIDRGNLHGFRVAPRGGT